MTRGLSLSWLPGRPETEGAGRVGKTGCCGAARTALGLSRGLSETWQCEASRKGTVVNLCVCVCLCMEVCLVNLDSLVLLERITPSPGFRSSGADRDFPPPARGEGSGYTGPGSSPLVLEAGRDLTHTPHMKARTAQAGSGASSQGFIRLE